MQIRTAVVDYLRAKYSLAFKTKLSYKQHLERFTAWCEQQGIELEGIKPRTVDQFASEELANRSSRTRFSYVRVIKTFLAWCRDEEDYEGFISETTVRRIKLPKVDHKIIIPFTTDELHSLFMACEREEDPKLRVRDKAILSLLLDCGLRISELAFDSTRPHEVTGLRVDRVFLDIEKPYVRVMGKGKKERGVGLGKKTKHALKRYIEDYRGDSASPYVFLSRRGDPLTIGSIEDVVCRLAAWAGIKNAHPHKFRHTFAVMHLKLTGDLYKTSRQMGHSRIDVTENYLRSIEDEYARNGPSVLDGLSLSSARKEAKNQEDFLV